jgi:hypothetical protein
MEVSMSVDEVEELDALADQCRTDLDRHGYALVPGFLSEEELAAGQAAFARQYPTPDELAAAGPHKFAYLRQGPVSGIQRFPVADDVLNDQLTSPRMVALARRLIGTPDIRLRGALTWAKYGGLLDYDQEFHFDGYAIACPRESGIYREVQFSLYYSDVTAECGPMRAVSYEDIPDFEPGVRKRYSRSEHPDLYARETAMIGPAGSLAIFTGATIHRGSALGSAPAYRFTTTSAFRATACDWMFNYYPVGAVASREQLDRFLTRATPEQRTLLGFPPPGDSYWDKATLTAVAARYSGMDMTPYEAALAG